MFWLQENLILMKKMSKKCSTCVQLNRVAYILELLVTKLKIGTLVTTNLEVDVSRNKNYLIDQDIQKGPISLNKAQKDIEHSYPDLSKVCAHWGGFYL